MIGNSVGRFTDPGRAQAAVRAADVDLTITGRGKFEMTLAKIDMPRIWMMGGNESTARIAKLNYNADRWIMFFLKGNSPALSMGGRELAPGAAMLTSMGQQYYQYTSGAIEWGTISLAPHAFAEAAQIITGNDVAFAAGQQVFPSGPEFQLLQRLHTQASVFAASSPGLLSSAETARTLDHALTRAMITSLWDGTANPDTRAWRRHTVLMARFMAVLDLKHDCPLHVMDICLDLGISEWTLRQLCHDHLGMSPKRYLSLRRMHLAQQALLRGEPGKVSVTEIAMAQGFLELGRFSVEYRRLFSETPSTTLRRAPDARAKGTDVHRLAMLPEFA